MTASHTPGDYPIDGSFVEAFRGLLLPIQHASEANTIRSAYDNLDELLVEPGDRSTWIRVEQQNWREVGNPSPEFQKVISHAIAESNDDIATLVSEKYFGTHRTLRKEQYDLSFDAVTALMSHARTALQLARNEVMSASQIANLLSARQGSFRFPWNTVHALLRQFGAAPAVREDDLTLMWNADSTREVEDFADADSTTSTELVADVAKRLGFPGDIQPLLSRMYSGNSDFVGPFLQILHFQSALVEFFDHPPTWAYEFAPRGHAALSLFDRYPGFMGVSGNPILNNAKAASRLDEAWALSRNENQRPAALALSRLLIGIEQMAYSAARELAGWLRRWLMRVIRLEGAKAGSPSQLQLAPGADIARFLRNMASQPTKTFGILEQRLVDVATSLKHRSPWISRGLGDSVNATNVSRRKLGDCDFQNGIDRSVIAYESHGGVLSQLYVNEHMRTLASTLPLRRVEWGDEDWAVEVVFVCHGTRGLRDTGTVIVSGTTISWRTLSFHALVDEIIASFSQEILTDAVNTRLVYQLNQPRTPRIALESAQQLL